MRGPSLPRTPVRVLKPPTQQHCCTNSHYNECFPFFQERFESLCLEICGVGLLRPAPLLFVSAGKPAGGASLLHLCAPPVGGTVEKTQRRPVAAASGNGRADMPDYKQMYLTLFNATEEAINRLIQAQQACEELYISAAETETSETEQ